MSNESIESRVEKLEKELTALKKKLPNCPNPDCGAFILMADEDREHSARSGNSEHVVESHHFQCYACGSWWDVDDKEILFKSTAKHKVGGSHESLPKGVIPQKRQKK